MITLETQYAGDLRTEVTHVSSGNILITDAPIDNKGKGETFSPTDLMCASLVSCMLTIIGISGNSNNFSIDGTKVKTTKVMASGPRRVGTVQIEFFMPDISYTTEQKEMIARSALNCPVAKSIHPDIKLDVTFHFNDEDKIYN